MSEKSYICIFSCMNSRAVHLELVENMTTEAFLTALERMINRKGHPNVIYSDNAKTFKSSSTILKSLFNSKQNRRLIEQNLQKKEIEWKFITERAPWHGGFYERMVRSVKTPLKKILKNAKLNYIEFSTLLTDIEAQINSRPLYNESANPYDPEPLTPAHLFLGRSLKQLPDCNLNEKRVPFAKRWRYRNRLSKLFWNRWTKEYMLQLNEFKKWIDSTENANVGDVVLIQEDNVPKSKWVLGRIESLNVGRDGLTRSVFVKTKKRISPSTCSTIIFIGTCSIKPKRRECSIYLIYY